MRRWLGAAGIGACLVVVACSKGPSGEAKDREEQLLADPLNGLVIPGGEQTSESSSAGGATDSGDNDVTVMRVYTTAPDLRATAVAVLQQSRERGWTVTANCDANGDDFVLLGVKDFEGFRATFSAVIWVRPQNGVPQVEVEITAPYPGEETTATLGPSFSQPTCLDA